MLEIKNLRKTYGPLVAVEDLSLTLHPGDVFGFIGSNGAGKTTTIRMIATLLEPTSGTATINGADIWNDPMEVRRQIGYMPDFFGLYDDVKVWEYLDFFASIYRVPKEQRPGVIDNVLELTDLTVKRDSFVQSLSRGMQQRLCLARCLVHDPALLLLDEPASGLDPRARADLKELILELGRMGKIVIVSSHILSELSGFCNKVGIIERGKLLVHGAVKDVLKSVRPTRTLEARFLEPADTAIAFAQGRPLVVNVQVGSDNQLTMEFRGTVDEQADLLAAFLAAGHRVIDFREVHGDLEDAFMRLTTGAVN